MEIPGGKTGAKKFGNPPEFGPQKAPKGQKEKSLRQTPSPRGPQHWVKTRELLEQQRSIQEGNLKSGKNVGTQIVSISFAHLEITSQKEEEYNVKYVYAYQLHYQANTNVPPINILLKISIWYNNIRT